MDIELRTILDAALAEPAEDFEAPGTVPAGVLVPFVLHSDGWRLVFTRRAEGLRRHKGEISFPGGRVDEGEITRQAALREAHEELGIVPEHVDLVGKLGRVFTAVSNYVIEPWVGIMPLAELTPNPAEIAEVIEVPLEVLLSPDVRRTQKFIFGSVVWTNPAFDIGNDTIWGATARILGELMDRLAPLLPGTR